MYLPPDVLNSSFFRSVIRRNPSASSSPISPVLNHPSSVKAAGCGLVNRMRSSPSISFWSLRAVCAFHQRAAISCDQILPTRLRQAVEETASGNGSGQ